MTVQTLKELRFDGKKLRQLRGERTLQEVAEMIGITPQSVSDMELGKIRPSADNLARLCAVLGVEISAFYDNAFFS